MSDTDFAALMEPVARALWGDPNPKLSTKREIKWGSQGSKNVNLEKGTFFDHEAGAGGGVIDLVMLVNETDKDGALEWLAEAGFIAKSHEPQRRNDGPPPAEPRDEYQPSSSPPEGQRKIVDVYDYTDRDGTLVYQVCRFMIEMPDGSYALTKDGKGKWKTFLQRRPSGLQDKSMIWGLSAGQFMRPGPGKDWSRYDDEKIKTWPNAQVREFTDEPEHTIYRHPKVEIAISENKPVLLVEGEKDVHTAEKLEFTATTNSGGAKHWSERLAQIFDGADVIIPIDADQAGKERGDILARSLWGIAARIRILDLSHHTAGFKHKGDITDWVEQGGSKADLEEIIESLDDWTMPPPASKFRAVGLHELNQPHLAHEYVIDDYLERNAVALMVGESGSGKSFLSIELGLCVALGRPFWGKRVRKGLVLYQDGDGQRGVAKRLEGWMNDRGVEDPASVPFRYMPRKINLFYEDKDTLDLIDEGKAWSTYLNEPVRLVVIDTLNKAMSGANENSGQDINKVIERAERIRDELDCCVLISHHLSAQGKLRGHTSLTGDTSDIIKIEKLQIKDANGRPIRTVRLDKEKDGEGTASRRFVLRQVVVNVDENNRPVTTCVVDQPDGDEQELVTQGKLSQNQLLVLRTLKLAIERHGEEAPTGMSGVPKGKLVVQYKLFHDELAKTWPYRSSESEADKRQAELNAVLSDAGKKLQLGNFIDRDNDKKLIWWTGKSEYTRRTVPVTPRIEPQPNRETMREIQSEGIEF